MNGWEMIYLAIIGGIVIAVYYVYSIATNSKKQTELLQEISQNISNLIKKPCGGHTTSAETTSPEGSEDGTVTDTQESVLQSTTQRPKNVPAACVECEYYLKKGIFHPYEGTCKFYNKTTRFNSSCKEVAP